MLRLQSICEKCRYQTPEYTACAFCADISSDSERTIACTPCRTSLSGTPHTTARSCASFKSRSSYKEQSKTERVESTRRRYGEFQNVFLSGEECTQLETAYPGKAVEYIERLSRYMASNDRHYANHYATIKRWLDEDSKGMSAKNYTYDDNEGECL